MTNLNEAILNLVNAPGYRPAKPRTIAAQLGLPKEEAVNVRRAVKRLVREGRVRYASNHLVMPVAATKAVGRVSPRSLAGEESGERVRRDKGRQKRESVPARSPSSAPARSPDRAAEEDALTPALSRREKGRSAHGGHRVLGTFQRTQKGFGFVRLRVEASAEAARTAEKPADIYIPANRTGDAATGDVVMVELGRPRPGEPGPRGAIVEVIERQTREFVGTYIESAGAAFVRIDGALFARPIYVGDPGAKNARPDDKVVIEMLHFPSPLKDGEGVISEVLGPRGRPGVDTLSIIREFGLPDRFAEDAAEEARHEAEAFDESLGDRTDFTGETVITIDPVDARDFDDAISLEPLPQGDWRLGVHIADVSHFIRPGTALDREALERATSVYLPDRVLPMLPEVISNGLASLQPGKVRYTKSAVMDFTAEGLRVSTELHSAAIRSSKRLTYEQVDAFLEEPASARRKLGGRVCDLLGRMHTLAMTLRKRRMANGALELDMPEVKVELDKQGRVAGAHVVKNTVSHQIIEEFMLAANEAVADAIHDRGLDFLRRVHPSPSPQKLKALTEFVAELGYKTRSLESRFELQKLLGAAVGRPEHHAVHFAVLRSMQRAIYSPVGEGHYALASECYCHFTSPIRRYPDLTIHRLVDMMLRKGKSKNVAQPAPAVKNRHKQSRSAAPQYDELVVLGRHCSDREQRAETAERELTKLKLLAYLSDRIGEEMDAVVTGVESYGLFVQGVQLPAEGLVRVETLRDDTYRFDRASHTLAGYRAGNSYRLGDLVRVAVSRVDLERREIDFRIVDAKRQGPSTAAGRGKNSAHRKAEGRRGRGRR